MRAIKPEFAPSGNGELGALLRSKRRRLGLSVKEAAAQLGVRRWTWGLWEAGTSRPQARLRTALERFLAEEK
ncbi:MAG: hypothetical protein ACREEW_14675 [Caulobacteraceae bacterium]